MKYLLNITLLIFTQSLFSQNTETKTALELFVHVSDNYFMQRELPWQSPGKDLSKEFWKEVKKNSEEFKKTKFQKLHRKIDQRAYSYLLDEEKKLADFHKADAAKLPLALLIRKVFHYRYIQGERVDEYTEFMVKNLDDKLVSEVCLDMSTYRHTYLNGMQLPEKIGKVKHKLSPVILEKLSKWIILEDDYFYHKEKILISIISGNMFLDKKAALKNYSILLKSLNEEQANAKSLKDKVQSVLSLVKACMKSKESGNDNALIELMNKGNKAAYLVSLSRANNETVSIFLEKYPYRSWKEVDDVLKIEEALKEKLEKAISLNDWRKPYLNFLMFAIEKPKEYKDLKSKFENLGDNVMKVAKIWAEKN